MSSFLNSISKRKKNPEQVVASALVFFTATAECTETRLSTKNNVCKRLGQMKNMRYGDSKTNEVDEEKALELARYIISENCLMIMIDKIELLPLEARKDTVIFIFSSKLTVCAKLIC